MAAAAIGAAVIGGAGAAVAATGTGTNVPAFMVKSWQTDDGLPQNSVNAFAQTPDGYLWFSTFKGLARFDGVKFTVFDSSNTPELSGASFTKLHVDRSGKLWAGTSRGLLVRDGERWQFMDTPGTNGMFGSNMPYSFVGRTNGDLLMTTYAGEVLEFSGRRFRALPAPPGEPGQPCLGYADEAGRWWVVQPKFIGLWDGARWQEMVPLTGLTNLTPQNVGCATARDGGLWLLLGQELRKIRHGAEVSRRPLAKFNGGFSDMTEDSRGQVWVATMTGGLWQLGGDGQVHRWSRSNGLPDNYVIFVREDAERNIWAGTMRGGLLRFKERAFQSFLTVTGLVDHSLLAVAAHPTGGVFIAKYGQSLSRFDEGVITKVGVPAPLRGAADSTGSVLVDRAGRTWLGTKGDGLWMFDSQTNRHIPKEQSGGRNVSALFEDSRGRIWMAGGQSVAVFDGVEVRGFGPEQGVPSGEVWSFAEDKSGALWIAQARGVFRWATDRFTPVLDTEGRTNRVNGLYADAEGGMWMGTLNNGLQLWREGRIARRELPSGLPMRGVGGFVEDNEGFLWMPSDRGILRARRSALQSWLEGTGAAPAFQVFDLADGLPDVRCAAARTAITARDAKGRLWFALSRGVAMIDPAALRLNPVPPPVVIEEMTYHRAAERVYAGAAARAPAPTVQSRLRPPFAGRVTLPPGSRRMEIRYTALNFTAPEKVRFQVKLEPGDTEWHDAGDRRVADYYDFRPGEYVFRVRAANNDGLWNETGASLAFMVQPFVWQIGWVRALMALLLAGSGGGAVWVWARARLRHAAEREKAAREIRDLAGRLITAQEEERARLARELHDDLSQSLALLSVDLELFGQKPLSAPEQINTRMQELSSQVKGLSSEVHRLSHELHPAKLEQLGLTAAVRGFCRELSAAHQMAVHFEAGDVPRTLPNDLALCLYRITQEALQNVVKHSGASSAQVALGCAENEVRLSIVDDGEGFDAAAVQGRGSLGLVGMRERVRLVQGRLSVESKPGGGTRVEVCAPLSPSK